MRSGFSDTPFLIFVIIMLLSFPGCSIFRGCNSSSETKKFFNQGEINSGKRIISLSPSVTGQIIDLGAEENIVGVTPYHPALKKEITVVGTYITPSIEKIVTLKPDIIFMSEEDGEIQKNSFFEKFGLKYHMFRRNSSFKSICDNYRDLAMIIDRGDYAEKKINDYKSRLKRVKKNDLNLRVAFLVSAKPLITVSKLSFISGIIKDAGGINVFDELKNPYPILSLESLVIKNPDVVIIMIPGDDLYLNHQLRNFTSVNFVKKKNIFVAGDEVIPYYSPGEYILSVERISRILSLVAK